MKSNTDTKSKLLLKETVFKSKYYQIDQVTIERNGKTFKKDLVTRVPVVMILPITENNEIYLIEQFRDSLQKVLLETVAGKIKPNETLLDNAKRELKEEAGLTAKIWKQISTFHVSANMKGEVSVFVATDLAEGQQDLDTDEEIKVIKIPFAEALEKIEAGEISVSSNVAAILLLDKLRKEGKI